MTDAQRNPPRVRDPVPAELDPKATRDAAIRAIRDIIGRPRPAERHDPDGPTPSRVAPGGDGSRDLRLFS